MTTTERTGEHLALLINEDKQRATLRFSHPRGNIITARLVAELRQAAEDLSRSTTLKLLMIEGQGLDFSFGASVPEHAPDRIDAILAEFHALIIEWLHLPMATAAVVRGRCLGGGFELALMCDFIFASETARFALPEISLGVFAPAASVLLPKRVGASRATSALLTGRAESADVWRQRGLIEAVAASDAELGAVVADWFAGTLARHSAESLRHGVTAARGAWRTPVAAELAEVERLYVKELMATDDAREGIQAFLEKRAPKWRDR